MAETIEITEELPQLPETASKYNEQFLEEMDRTLDILPSWTTKLNTLAKQINNFRKWLVSQSGFYQEVIQKADDIKGYVIPSNTAYSVATMDDLLKKNRSHAKLIPDLPKESMLIPFSNTYTIQDWVTIIKVQTVYNHKAWESRTDEEKALLEIMGLKFQTHFSRAFDIVKVEWTHRAGYALPFVNIYDFRKDSILTIAAYVKHIQGQVPYGRYCEGLIEGAGWQLCGENYESSPMNYKGGHPYTSDTQDGGGAVLIALPAVVDRYVDLSDSESWAGIFEN